MTTKILLKIVQARGVNLRSFGFSFLVSPPLRTPEKFFVNVTELPSFELSFCIDIWQLGPSPVAELSKA